MNGLKSLLLLPAGAELDAQFSRVSIGIEKISDAVRLQVWVKGLPVDGCGHHRPACDPVTLTEIDTEEQFRDALIRQVEAAVELFRRYSGPK